MRSTAPDPVARPRRAQVFAGVVQAELDDPLRKSVLSPKRVVCHYVPEASFLTVHDTLLRQRVIRERVPLIKKITPRAHTKPNHGSLLSSLPGYDDQRVRESVLGVCYGAFIFLFVRNSNNKNERCVRLLRCIATGTYKIKTRGSRLG